MPVSSAAAAEAVAADEARRIRAARQARKDQVAAATLPTMQVRVLKMGADKISTGYHIAGIGEDHYELGDRFNVRQDIALELEEKGYVEVEGLAGADADEAEPLAPLSDLEKNTVAELLDIAKAENVDLGEAHRKAELIAKITEARAAKAGQ